MRWGMHRGVEGGSCGEGGGRGIGWGREVGVGDGRVEPEKWKNEGVDGGEWIEVGGRRTGRAGNEGGI